VIVLDASIHAPHLIDVEIELRDNLTAYDAAYVVLAEILDAPLITCDGKAASAPGHHARIEVN
jgi:predicted nucleic acid-binding protein